MQNFIKVRLVFVLVLFLAIGLCGESIDLDRQFTQKLDEAFFRSLIDNPGKERAVFLHNRPEKVDFAAYLRFDQAENRFVFRGNLPEVCEAFSEKASLRLDKTLFAPQKKNDEPLYQYGAAFRLNIGQAELVYVPHFIKEKPNQAFISDLGYFEASFSTTVPRPQKLLNQILQSIGSEKTALAKAVALNRYYLFRDSYFGPVHFFTPASIAKISQLAHFWPLHKFTMNKHVSDHDKKEKLDRDMLFEILDEDFLLSQDQRLKLKMVPRQVKLNWSRIDQTDIGSGQNGVIFLSAGPGINYFDDPWRAPRKNLPGPRLIFSKGVYGFKRLQLFPTFSIEPEQAGEARLQAINDFQQIASSAPKHKSRQPLWASQQARHKITGQIEEKLCEYNLLHDSEDLRPGFRLFDRDFKGNIVNNEIRVADGISLRSMLCGMIVPPGTSHKYINAYIQAYRNTGLHWQYNCATGFKDLFIEANEPTDKGFRIAWLKWHLNKTHPGLARILDLAAKAKSPALESIFAEKIARMIQKEGKSFFATVYAKHRARLDSRKLELWCDYLEACRLNSPDKIRKYATFVTFINSIESGKQP